MNETMTTTPGESGAPHPPPAAEWAPDVEWWRAVGTDTRPADRERAEAGVRTAYRRAGLPEPSRIVWAGSPRAGAAAALELREAGARSVREQVRTGPWAAERERWHRALGPVGFARHWSLTGDQLWDRNRSLTERVRLGVVDALVAERAGAGAQGGTRPDGPTEAERVAHEAPVRLALLDAVLGQHDAAWLAALTIAPAEPGPVPDAHPAEEGAGPLDGLVDVARSAGWWWPYQDTVVICERPVELHRDEAGRLDRGDGPALRFPDGFALYAWRGMPVPASFLDELGDITPERIRGEENAELRRVMLEFYGYDRYLAESGAQPVHRDDTGVLWRIELEDDEPVVMVEVVNSTPEPDGTSRTYWLRVPPTTRTARAGVAWTFGLSEEGYFPRAQT